MHSINDQGISSMLSNLNILSDDLKRLEYLKLKLIDMGVSGAFSKSNENHGTGTEVIKKSHEISGRNQGFKDETYKPYINVPKHWAWATTEELCFTQTGTTPEKGLVPAGMESITYITSADLNEFAAHSTTKVLKYPKSKTIRVAPAGSVLFVGIGSIGKCGVTTEEVTFNQQIHAATPYVMNPKYLCYFYSSSYFRNQFSAISSATTLTILNKSKWSGIHIPVPTLGEQERIVDQIENLLAICAQIGEAISLRTALGLSARKSVVNACSIAQTPEEVQRAWERIQQNWDVIAGTSESINEMRGLILNLATSGLLVKQNLTEAQPSFVSVTVTKQIPENWIWSELEAISQYGGNGSIIPESIPKESWILDLEDIEKKTSKLLARSFAVDRKTSSNKSPFEVGDVLYGKLRPYLDKVLVADMSGFCTTEIVPIKPKEGLDPNWLRICLKRPDFVKKVTELSYGTKMPRLGTSDAKKSVHPIPPLEEQRRIVERVDQLMQICDQLEKELILASDLAERFSRSVVSASV